ncbi:hypothetical protein O4J56_21230 [Nocardiopsis sp. RSe5-2]|uniref:DUF2269 domain-containing protein n=1 Tax=Nocardiopsis endophytica TaxID=3018445 RepID=A0ABT4U8A2_9ACTN|nr:hypothetical protein [Nocardiopsis endophytica]MDA2813182.1 hypothetical protein [Nocardiopsis endophytica]
MRMPPRLRTAALTAHIAVSVGWMGAVAAVLVLGVVGLASDDPAQVRGAYLAMDPLGRYALLPLAAAALATGVLQSLGTRWGLFLHYWVAVKLWVTAGAALLLAAYLPTLAGLAAVAADPAADAADMRSASPVLHAGLALAALAGTTLLGAAKPRGRTARGRRLIPAGAPRPSPPSRP